MTHKHRAVTKEQSGWTHCVLPVSWYPYKDRERRRHDGAHGGVIEIRRCSCGAEQLIERNAGRSNAGPWVEMTQGRVRPTDVIGVIRAQYRVGSCWRELDLMIPIDSWRALRRALAHAAPGQVRRYLAATIELAEGSVVAVTFRGSDGDSITAEAIE